MKVVKIDGVNRKVGVTADLHYGHKNILAYCKRPFMTAGEVCSVLQYEVDEKLGTKTTFPSISKESLRRHNDTLVNNINATLKKDDVLLILGDVAWGYENLRELRSRLIVDEVVVAVGNHDDEDELRSVFGNNVYERFKAEIETRNGRRQLICDHYPGDSWDQSHRGSFHLFGHCHNTTMKRRNANPRYACSLDVGVDGHDYWPWLFTEELMPLLDKRYSEWKENQQAILET